MITELNVQATHQGGMRVLAGNADHKVVMDYPLQADQASTGLTPLQMLLASLAACSANSVVMLLKKMNQPIAGLDVHARALRQSEHPTVLTEISLGFLVKGSGIDPELVARALSMSENQICPVWNMLKGGTPIKATFSIIESPTHDEVCAVH